jgi:hypothetical protein
MDAPRRVVLEQVYCDILTSECPNPEISCFKCSVFKKECL